MSCGAPFGNPAASSAREARGLCVPASRRVCLFVDVFCRLYAPRTAEKYSEVRTGHKGAFIGLSYLSARFGAVPSRTWRLLSPHTGLYLSAGCPSPSGRDLPPAPSACPYSPECVEGKFAELRLYEVLGSSGTKAP